MAEYVIVGHGRVGANMASYLDHLGHQISVISRQFAEEKPEECVKLINAADVIAAAIPDDRLEGWHDQWRHRLGDKTTIHFSGAVTIDGAFGFHPLYSFPNSPVAVDDMKRIAFACPKGGPSFADVFVGAPNPHFDIADSDRARYHALAVLSGNLASYLWNETAREIAGFAGMAPETIMESYLGSLVDGFVANPTASLTGPIARRDAKTVDANLASLAADPKLRALYAAFLAAAWPDYDTTPKS